jgi:hypothetical protein
MTQSLEARVAEVLAGLGSTLDEGASLHLLALDDGIARVELRVEPEAWDDCIVPLELLQTVLESRLMNKGDGVIGVEIVDGRNPAR